MALLKKIPHTYTIIAVLILVCAVLSWIIPAGEYERHVIEVEGVKRTVIVDHSFHRVEQSPQTWQVFGALLQGFEKQAGIIAFLLIIGGAFQILNSGKAVDVGILSFLRFTQGLERYRFMKRIGVNNIILSFIIILFSLFGSVFGISSSSCRFFRSSAQSFYDRNCARIIGFTVIFGFCLPVVVLGDTYGRIDCRGFAICPSGETKSGLFSYV